MTTRMRPLAIVTLVALIAALLAATPLAGQADAESAFAQAESSRISGDDSVGTAIAVSQTYDTSSSVVVARVDDYADALAGSTLAAQLEAPILFTTPDTLSDGVGAEITRLGATEVVILGGVDAVSQTVEDQLAEVATTRRVWGPNRFATALEIAAELLGDTVPETVFFVEGENLDPTAGWPDAINIAAVAAWTGQPILPVNAERVPADIQAQWDAWAAEGAEGIIVGGVDAVTEDTGAALAGEDAFEPLPRLAGPNRSATSSAVYAYSVSEALMDPSVRFVIPGGSFVEGLAASAVAGREGHPLVMVDSVDPANSPEGMELLSTNLDTFQAYILVGDEDVLSPAVADAVAAASTPTEVNAATCLTLLHHNDGESQLLGAPVSEDFGSLARMVTLANAEQAAAEDAGCAPITVTSGDNFLAGPALTASDPTNDALDAPPVLDALGLSLVGYDALAIGNHDFDFGPDFAARFIRSFDPAVPFLSANLDVSAVPSLQALADEGRIMPSVTVDAGGTPVGIIGLTTPFLRSISSPGDVDIDREIVAAVQSQVDTLTDEGTDHIILISHLQGLSADIDFVSEISGIDVVVAGGGDEVLADPADPLVPGDLGNVADSYPLELTDADGEAVPTVTTAGDYKYLGRLTLYFGDDGELLADTPYDVETSRMLRVAGESVFGGVARNATVVEEVEGPVRDFVETLEETVIATSEVDLDGQRPNIRQTETNLGNLVADAHRWVAETRGPEFGIDTAATQVVGIQNGGGIRNNSVIPAGDITELTTFEILPFANFVAAVPDFTAQQLKDVLETAYASLPDENGAFSHVSNLVVEIDADQTAQVIETDDEGNVTITTPGERIRSMTFGDGTVLVEDGAVVDGAPTFVLSTIDFSLRNGDGYPFNLEDGEFTLLETSYQQGLSSYIQANADGGGLQGLISDEAYPEGGEGRITITGGATE